MDTYSMAVIHWQGKCSYDDSAKNRFRFVAIRFLKELRTKLGIEADIRFNPGGIAVSGDATLHGDSVYVTLNADSLSLGILYRSCKGRKDYTGGTNNWMPFSRLAQNGINGLVAEIRSMK